MSQIIEQGLVFNLNVNAIVLGKEDKMNKIILKK